MDQPVIIDTNSVQRKQFFDFPLEIRRLAAKLRTPPNRLCFLLSCELIQALQALFPSTDIPFPWYRVCSSACRYPARWCWSGQVITNKAYIDISLLILKFYAFREFSQNLLELPVLIAKTCKKWFVGKARGDVAGVCRRFGGLLAAYQPTRRIWFLGGKVAGFFRYQTPKINDLNRGKIWEVKKVMNPFFNEDLTKILWDFTHRCWNIPFNQ